MTRDAIHAGRVLVAGISGAGKTRLARRLSERLGLPYHELDALHHGPGWVPRPEFAEDVRRFAARDEWVTEDQYHSILGDLLWERADTVIWLDLPRRTIMWRGDPAVGVARDLAPRAVERQPRERT